MNDRIVSLSKELLEAQDLEEARRIARELQQALRDHVDELHGKVRGIPKRNTDLKAKQLTPSKLPFGQRRA